MDAKAIISVLERGNEVSLANSAADHFRKSLLLACASYFERVFCDLLVEFTTKKSGGDEKLTSIVRTRVVSRSYHQWFVWDAKNANSFYSMFGPDFKQVLEYRHLTDDVFKKSVRAFLEIGNERNKLVHQNYATFQMNKTIDEIYSLYTVAHLFEVTIRDELFAA